MSDLQQNSYSNITFDYNSYMSYFLLELVPQMLHFSSTHPVSVKSLPQDTTDHENMCVVRSTFL